MQTIVFLVVLAWSIGLMVSRKKKVADGQVSNDPLTTGEKVSIWIMGILNPILSDLILYYGWRKKLPMKAKQANIISIWAFVIVLVIVILLFVTGSIHQ